jgi:glycosyltransferase involved in cell wall biosynthesis
MNHQAFNQPSISVVITTYQRPEYLSSALSGVLAQTVKAMEIIVINDSPNTDYSGCDELVSLTQAKVINTEGSKGANYARNKGVSVAQGDVVAFLDDDDIWLPDYLLNVVKAYTDDKNVAATLCGKKIMERQHIEKVNDDAYLSKVELQKGNTYCGVSGFTAKKACLELVSFDETLKNAQDWDIYIRLFQSEMCVKNISLPLYLYRTEVNSGITKTTQKIKPTQALYRFDAAVKHRVWLGEVAFRERIISQTLSNLMGKKHRFSWIMVCVEFIGWKNTVFALFRKLFSKKGDN